MVFPVRPGGVIARRANSASGVASLESRLGAALIHQWEVPESDSPLITLNGSNVSQLNDRKTGSTAHEEQATAGNQPAHFDSGGLGGRPYIQLQDSNRFLSAPINVSAGHRVALYVVMQPTWGSLSHAVSLECRGPGAVYYMSTYNTPRHRMYCAFTGGAQDPNITSPAYAASWRLFAMRPLATGARCEIDNALTTPAYTGSDTVGALTTANIGAISGIHSGTGTLFGFAALVDESTDAAARHQHVIDYLNETYGTAY